MTLTRRSSTVRRATRGTVTKALCVLAIAVSLACSARASALLPVRVTFLQDAQSPPLSVYDPDDSAYKGGYNPAFAPRAHRMSCDSGGQYFSLFNASEPHNFILITNLNTSAPVVVQAPLRINVKSSGAQQPHITVTSELEGPAQIAPNATLVLPVTNSCPPPEAINDDNYWSLVEIGVPLQDAAPVTFQYVFACRLTPPNAQFDYTLFVLVVVACGAAFVLPRFQKIHGFNTQFFGYSVRWWFFFLYAGAIGIAGAFLAWEDAAVQQIVMSLAMPLCLGCGFFAFNEVLAFVPQRARLGRYVVQRVNLRVQDIIAAALTILLVAWYWLSAQAFYVNDIMALCIVTTMLKAFKFTSMREATIFLVGCLVTDVIAAAVAHGTQSQTYDSLVLQFFSCPFEVQVPTFTQRLLRNCVWLPATGIIFPGFFIAYTVRFDRSEMRQRNSNMYQILSFSGLCAGSLLWFLVTSFATREWPFSSFSYGLMLLFTGFFAWQRSEFNLIWNGSFHDSELLENIMKHQYAEESNNLDVPSRSSWKERVFTGLSYQDTVTKRRSHSHGLSFEQNFFYSMQRQETVGSGGSSGSGDQSSKGASSDTDACNAYPVSVNSNAVDAKGINVPLHPSNTAKKFDPPHDVIEEVAESDVAHSRFELSIKGNTRVMAVHDADRSDNASMPQGARTHQDAAAPRALTAASLSQQ